MTQRHLPGTRLRALRLDRGFRQADLAREAGISASYLNLIEHNHRRIGGGLLNALAGILDADPAFIASGPEGHLLAALDLARAGVSGGPVERSAEFAEAFPGWSTLVARQGRRIRELEDHIARLDDRLAHDPGLAAAMHELLTVATSIRSVASILVDGETPDADWLRRFHGSLDQDARRMADSTERLTRFFDGVTGEVEARAPVQELAEALVAAAEPEGVGEPAMALWGPVHTRLAASREVRSDDAVLAAGRTEGWRVDGVIDRLGLSPAEGFLRLAFLPHGGGIPRYGLLIVDMSGSVIFERPLNELSFAANGARCPFWPVFGALSQPGRAQSTRVREAASGADLDVWAVAEPVERARFGAPPRLEASMLFAIAADAGPDAGPPSITAGHGCRLCPREPCPARREDAIAVNTAGGIGEDAL